MTSGQLTHYVDRWMGLPAGGWVDRGIIQTKTVAPTLWGHVTYGMHYNDYLRRRAEHVGDNAVATLLTVNDGDALEGRVSVFTVDAVLGETSVALTVRYLGDANPAELPEVKDAL